MSYSIENRYKMEKDLTAKLLAVKYCLRTEQSLEAKEAFLSVLHWITKEVLIQFLESIGNQISKKAQKKDLTEILVALSPENLLKFAHQHRSFFSLSPTELEELLGCTKVERKRWTDEERLAVLEYREFKYGYFPVYDCIEIIKITSQEIETWRTQYKGKVKANRSQGAKKARFTQQENAVIRNIFKFQYKEAIATWNKLAPDAIDTLILAYWTMYMSRLAKTFQHKAWKAKKYEDLYRQKSEEYYEFKNQAIEILSVSPYAKLGYYSPASPDKVSYYYFWTYEDEIDEDRPYEIVDYGDNGKVKVEVEVRNIKNYYCLYYLSLEVPNVEERFSFHTPQNIGDQFFPDYRQLPLVNHQENEGMFRFGRELNDGELVTHTEKVILENFQSIFKNFGDYLVSEARKEKLLAIKREAEQRRLEEKASQERIAKLKTLNLDYSTFDKSWLNQFKEQFIVENPKITGKRLYTQIRDVIIEYLVLSLDQKILDYPEFNKSYVLQAVNQQFDNQKLRKLIGSTPQDIAFQEEVTRKKKLN